MTLKKNTGTISPLEDRMVDWRLQLIEIAATALTTEDKVQGAKLLSGLLEPIMDFVLKDGLPEQKARARKIVAMLLPLIHDDEMPKLTGGTISTPHSHQYGEQP